MPQRQNYLKRMHYPEYKKLPNRLRVIRKEKNLKPKDVAEIMGLRFTSQLSQWESGRSMPTLISAFRLARAYGVIAEDLFIDHFHKAGEEITPKAAKVYERVRREAAQISTGSKEILTN